MHHNGDTEAMDLTNQKESKMNFKPMTLKEAQFLIELRAGNWAILSKKDSKEQNAAKIKAREDHVQLLLEQGHINHLQASKLLNGYIANLQAKYL